MVNMAVLLRAGEGKPKRLCLGNKPTPWTRLLICVGWDGMCKELETDRSTGDGREMEFSPGNRHDFSSVEQPRPVVQACSQLQVFSTR